MEGRGGGRIGWEEGGSVGEEGVGGSIKIMWFKKIYLRKIGLKTLNKKTTFRICYLFKYNSTDMIF